MTEKSLSVMLWGYDERLHLPRIGTPRHRKAKLEQAEANRKVAETTDSEALAQEAVTC